MARLFDSTLRIIRRLGVAVGFAMVVVPASAWADPIALTWDAPAAPTTLSLSSGPSWGAGSLGPSSGAGASLGLPSDAGIACGACEPVASCGKSCGCCFPWWILAPLAIIPFFFMGGGSDDDTQLWTVSGSPIPPPQAPTPPPVPEPGTIALFGAGLAALAARRRRQRARAAQRELS